MSHRGWEKFLLPICHCRPRLAGWSQLIRAEFSIISFSLLNVCLLFKAMPIRGFLEAQPNGCLIFTVFPSFEFLLLNSDTSVFAEAFLNFRHCLALPKVFLHSSVSGGDYWPVAFPSLWDWPGSACKTAPFRQCAIPGLRSTAPLRQMFAGWARRMRLPHWQLLLYHQKSNAKSIQHIEFISLCTTTIFIFFWF